MSDLNVSKTNRIEELVEKLNNASAAYYNGQDEIMSNFEWDAMFDELTALEEETGYKSDEIEWLLTMRTTIGFCNEKIEIYVAKNLKESKQNLDENEYVDVKPYTVSELKELIYSGKIEDSKTIAAILAYADKYL